MRLDEIKGLWFLSRCYNADRVYRLHAAGSGTQITVSTPLTPSLAMRRSASVVSLAMTGPAATSTTFPRSVLKTIRIVALASCELLALSTLREI